MAPPQVPPSAGGDRPDVKHALEELHWSVKYLTLVAHQLGRLAPPIQGFIAIIGLVIALYSGKEWWQQASHIQERMEDVLRGKLETTDTPYKGIVAYLLSEHELPKQPEHLSSDRLDGAFGKVRSAITDAANSDPKQLDTLLSTLSLDVSTPGKAFQQALVGHTSHAFLTVPAISLRNRSSGEPKPITKEGLPSLLPTNSELLYDLWLATHLGKVLQSLDGARIGTLEIKQSYFITDSGLLLIRKPRAENQHGYYRNQFPPHFYFTQRPYFWKSVTPSPTAAPAPFDHRSEPYIDMGGNGLVLTYTKRFELPADRVGVLCMDVKLPDDFLKTIERRIKRDLHGEGDTFTWDAEGPEGTIPEDFKWFEEELKRIRDESAADPDHHGRERQADYLGAIASEPDRDHGVIRFTIPLESEWLKSGRQTTIMWVRIDLDRLRQDRLRQLLGITLGVMLFLVAGVNVYQDYRLMRVELRSVLNNLTRVMEKARTPFAWLNEKNEFEGANLSFLEVTGYNNLDELQGFREGMRRTFRSMVSAESQSQYDAVLDASKRGQRTDEYVITMIRKNDKKLRVKVHGERVPFPRYWRKRSAPHRIGILLEWEEWEPAKIVDKG